MALEIRDQVLIAIGVALALCGCAVQREPRDWIGESREQHGPPGLVVREWVVWPGDILRLAKGHDGRETQADGHIVAGVFDVKDYAVRSGVEFPPGATFITGYRESVLGMINTAQNLDRFEYLLKRANAFRGYPGQRIGGGNIEKLARDRRTTAVWDPSNQIAFRKAQQIDSPNPCIRSGR